MITTIGQIRKLISEAFEKSQETSYKSLSDIKNYDVVIVNTPEYANKGPFIIEQDFIYSIQNVDIHNTRSTLFGKVEMQFVKVIDQSKHHLLMWQIVNNISCNQRDYEEFLLTNRKSFKGTLIDLAKIKKIGTNKPPTPKTVNIHSKEQIPLYVLSQFGPLTLPELYKKEAEFTGSHHFAFKTRDHELWYRFIAPYIEPVGRKGKHTIYDLNDKGRLIAQTMEEVLDLQSHYEKIIPYLMSVNGVNNEEELYLQVIEIGKHQTIKHDAFLDFTNMMIKAIDSGLVYREGDFIFLTDEGQVLGDSIQEEWGTKLAEEAANDAAKRAQSKNSYRD
jgi:hypothetical protein